MSIGLLTLGNQLFDPKKLASLDIQCAYLREDFELCTYFKFHKLKIFFFLAAMRAYAEELREFGLKVTYEELKPDNDPYERHLIKWVKKNSLKKIFVYEIEDKFFEKRIMAALEAAQVEVVVLQSPMFLTTRSAFKTYLKSSKRPFLKTFYEAQRKRLKIMVNEKGEPSGGQWSFDELNRKPLPKNLQPPEPKRIKPSLANEKSGLIEGARKTCLQHFANHPGQLNDVWFPVDRKGAQAWLKDFIEHRLSEFGPYEDALTDRSDFVYHSVLTPFLNSGLLTPQEVVQRILRTAQEKDIPLSSVEGFIRQVIGWREFVRGIYQSYSEQQDTSNFWGHHRKLTPHWYEGTTGVVPLDQLIEKTNRLGYAHHIERLMVAGNLMVLLEVEPNECHRWFMEMFIDSSDWVMGPNVYGMGIFSDGGIFATKPYICGSNYYRKMGGFKKAEWCDAVDGLYWSFIEKHKKFFSKNPRLSMMVRTVEKMDPERKRVITSAARELRDRITTS